MENIIYLYLNNRYTFKESLGDNMNVVIAAAGTGGHINPGIAIANKIKQENKNAKITFVGTLRGLENDLVPRAGYELEKIEAYGISRKISIQNFKNMCKTLSSFGKAKKLIKKLNPDIVIGTGGYICGPVLLATNKYKIPCILHESNAYPGVTVKLLSGKVDEVLVGFEDAKARLPKAKKVIVTGTPTKLKKQELNNEQKEEIKKQLSIKDSLPIILVYGGSQGARTINEALLGIIENKLNEKYHIIWAVGQKQYDDVKQKLKTMGLSINNVKNASIVPYIYNMQEVMNLSDLIVARSGAMTITEVSLLGKPAIFVPFPYATENHQEYNAKVLVNAGGAEMILDKDLNYEILNNKISEIITNKEMQQKMATNAEKIAIQNVEERIYNEIKALL